jgi:hypothetical protein
MLGSGVLARRGGVGAKAASASSVSPLSQAAHALRDWSVAVFAALTLGALVIWPGVVKNRIAASGISEFSFAGITVKTALTKSKETIEELNAKLAARDKALEAYATLVQQQKTIFDTKVTAKGQDIKPIDQATIEKLATLEDAAKTIEASVPTDFNAGADQVVAINQVLQQKNVGDSERTGLIYLGDILDKPNRWASTPRMTASDEIPTTNTEIKLSANVYLRKSDGPNADGTKVRYSQRDIVGVVAKNSTFKATEFKYQNLIKPAGAKAVWAVVNVDGIKYQTKK